MYLTFIRKELLANIMSLRYGMVFILFLTLIVGATVVRTELYRRQVEDHREARSDRLEAMMGAKRYWQSRGIGVTVEKPPNPLAVFAFGLENEMTRSFSLSDWAVPRAGERKLSNPSFRYVANLDMVLVINIVCSLLAMLLVFDAVSGERERGTLKVLLAGPLPRDVVIVSKLLAGLLTVMIPLAMAWVLSLLYTTVAAGITFEGEDLARLLWIGAMSVLYILFFFSVGTAVTCWTHRSATALSICLFCWIVFVLAIPNLVPVVVDRFSPIPPESRIVLEKDAIFRQWQKTRQPKVYAELSATGKYDDIYELWDELMRIRREELDAESDKIDRFYKSRIEQQLRLNQAMSRLSPSAAMVYATTHLAGTGVRDFLRLISDVDAFGREYGEVKDQLEKERREKFKDADDRWPEAVEDAYDPTRYPPFEPGREQLAAVLNQSWIDIVLLFGGSIVFLLLSVIGFVRYDPR